MSAADLQHTELDVIVRDLGRSRYNDVFEAMKAFTENRTADTPDELWFTEHEPVFTQGQAGKAEHVLAPGDIPVVQTDRGGQVTYHGPGQIVGYLMFDLRRRGLAVRALVSGIEEACVRTVRRYGVDAAPRADAPGVYVQGASVDGMQLSGAKIASLGLRVRKGCSYHGLSLNVAMDLEPFARINPCGLFGIQVTDIAAFAPDVQFASVQRALLEDLVAVYGLNLGRSDILCGAAA